jgi:hypothetical protein
VDEKNDDKKKNCVFIALQSHRAAASMTLTSSGAHTDSISAGKHSSILTKNEKQHVKFAKSIGSHRASASTYKYDCV